ncbi:MAG TPA: ABC transporter ATP-binding protein [Dongiaceae bacterium]|nr:ABC transporter ATP-binding protein [Dongiaceae bacterium]
MKNAFRIFFYAGWRRELLVIGTVLLTGAVQGIGIASIWPIVALVSGGNTGKPHSMGNAVVRGLEFLGLPLTVEVLLGVIAVVSLASFALNAMASIFVGRTVADLTTRMRLRLINAVVRARWVYFTGQPTAKFMTAVSSDGNRASGAFRASGNVIASLTRVAVYLAIALWVSWQFFLAGLAVTALLWICVNRFMRIAKEAGRGKTRHTYLLNKSITDALTNIKALKAMNRHGFIAQSFVKNVNALRDALAAETYSEAAIRAIQEPLLIQFLLGGIYVAYTFFGMGLDQIIGSVVVLSGLSSAIGAVRGATQRVLIDSSAFWAMVRLIEETEREAEAVHGGVAPQYDAGCGLDKVSFAYGTTPVLKQVSLDIPPHAVTAIIGSSGSGKTTIADLLVGLHVPVDGKVTVGGRDLAEIDILAWRRQIGYIPQETILFNDTISNNVTLGDASISRENVIAALKAADAWDFVSALPGDIGYVIGVRGSLLSGGQRQRLSIARALCNDPQFLILDEATSALDRETALEIAAGIRKLVGEKTIFAITHQPIWVDAADKVYEMRAGEVRPIDRSNVLKPRPA